MPNCQNCLIFEESFVDLAIYLNILNGCISKDVWLFTLQYVTMPRVVGFPTAGVLCIPGLDVNSGYQKCGRVD